MKRTLLTLALLAVLLPGASGAHEIRPALLEITERDGGWIDVVWKVPTRGGRVMGLEPRLPEAFVPVAEPGGYAAGGGWIERSTWQAHGGALMGATVAIEGLSSTQTDALLRVTLADGTRHSAVLRPGSPSFRIPEVPGSWAVAKSYWRMGVGHILGGFDHLLFLFALLMLVPGVRKLVETITAFTVAHSATLALATLGFVHVAPAPTEAIISLSILFLAVELVREHAGEPVIAARYPAAVALAFGLFHGLGFAGALSEVGVPANEVPLALVMFNVGVETGQLLFVLVVLALFAGLRRLELPRPARAWWLAPYAIGSLAAFWTIERLVTAFTRSA